MFEPEVAISLNKLERGISPSKSNDQYAMPDVPRSEYHDTYVAPKVKHQPWLEILDDFIDPNKSSFAVPRGHRLSFFDVQVIHISASGEVNTPITCKNATEFREEISGADKERSGTLVIAEDLSRAMIDALGMQYDLEPEFFASHLQGTESFRTGHWKPPTVRAPNVLPDCLRKAPYYTTKFQRPYHILGGLNEIKKLRSSITSTPRGVGITRTDKPDTFVSEKISVYKRKGSNFGVILTDKLLSEEPPASYMLDPTIADAVKCHVEKSWLQQLKPQDAKVLFDDHEPLALCPVLKTVERASATFLEHAQYITGRIVTGHCDEQFPDSIPFFLQVLRSLHWEIYDQQKILRLALRIASLRGGEKIAEQIQDFKFLMEEMEGVLKSLEEDVRFLAAAASIREGKIVGWVSKFACLFLPVSLLANILAISDPGYTRFAILGGLSIPFVLISMYLMFFWKPSQIDSLSHVF